MDDGGHRSVLVLDKTNDPGEPAKLIEAGAIRDGGRRSLVRFANGTERWVPAAAVKEARRNGIAAAVAIDVERVRALAETNPAGIVVLALVELGGTAKRAKLQLMLQHVLGSFEQWWKKNAGTALRESDVLRYDKGAYWLNGASRSVSVAAILDGASTRDAVYRSDVTPASSEPEREVTTVAAPGTAELRIRSAGHHLSSDPDPSYVGHGMPSDQPSLGSVASDDAFIETQAVFDREIPAGSSSTVRVQSMQSSDAADAAHPESVTASTAQPLDTLEDGQPSEQRLFAPGEPPQPLDRSTSADAAPQHRARRSRSRSLSESASNFIERLNLPPAERGQAIRALSELDPEAGESVRRTALLEQPSLQRPVLSEMARSVSPVAALMQFTEIMQHRGDGRSASVIETLRRSASILTAVYGTPAFALRFDDTESVLAIAALVHTAERLALEGDARSGANPARVDALEDLSRAVISAVATGFGVARLLAALEPRPRHRVVSQLVGHDHRGLLSEVWAALPALPNSDVVALAPLLAEYALKAPDGAEIAAQLVQVSILGQQQVVLLQRLREHARRADLELAITKLLLSLPRASEDDALQLQSLLERQMDAGSPSWPIPVIANVVSEIIGRVTRILDERTAAAEVARVAAEDGEKAAKRLIANLEQRLEQVRSAAKQELTTVRRQAVPSAVREVAAQLREQVMLASGGATAEQRLEVLTSRLLASIQRAGIWLGDSEPETVGFDPEQHESITPGLSPGALVRILHPGFHQEEGGARKRVLLALVAPRE